MIVLLLISVVVGLARGDNVLVCASKTLDISCPVGEVLVFESAFYGRDDKTTCIPTGEDTKTDTSPCQMSSVVHLLNKKCFRKTTCSVQPEKALQPDPCPNTAKYLRTKYSCTLAHHIHTLCTSYYVHRQSGYLISPNYPRNYNANTKCTSEIQTEESDSQTHLTLLDIDMEARTKSKGCFDWLIVHDRSSPSEANIYCGTLDSIKSPTTFTLTNAVLKFKSDPKKNQGGFLMKFEAQKCQVPEFPVHGEVIYRKLAVGNEAEYICHKDYVLVGENSLTCMNNGQWSGFAPTCLESGSRSLSVSGELLVAVLLTLLFIFFKKRILKITGSVYITFGHLGNAFAEKHKEAD